jgi:hypothetical protein
MKNKKMFVGVMVLLLLGVCSGVAFASTNIQTGVSTYVYSDSVGVTKLPIGCVVEVIRANGSIHAPDASGGITGGDVLLKTFAVAGGPGDIYTSVSEAAGNKIYVRAWNANTIASATKYGDSIVYTIVDPGPPAPPTPWNVPSFATASAFPPVASTAPTVTGLSSHSGVNTSTTSITITGTNLTGATAVHLGATSLPITTNTATSITTTVPAGLTAGTYDITVTTANGTSAINANDRFTVTANTSITPPPNAIYAKAGGIMMAYPNPFNPNDKANPLKMLFEVSAVGDTVSIYIFDANGRIIYQDKNSTVALDRIVTWDGISSYGGTVNNGIYLIRVVDNGKLVAKAKILVLKK